MRIYYHDHTHQTEPGVLIMPSDRPVLRVEEQNSHLSINACDIKAGDKIVIPGYPMGWYIVDKVEDDGKKKETDEKFWLVWNPWHGDPNKRHPTRAEALNEALRITKKENKTTYVLESTDKCEPIATVNVTHTKLN